MDEDYILRNFKNAKVTKQAVVTIDDVEHEVTPAQVQGNILKAEDLNYMDSKIKNLYDKKLINKTVVELKTVAEEAPIQCEEGDLYYNTTTNLIYKATGNNVWGATGETPTSKYLYVDKTNSKLYYYDGQGFNSYGGGGGINLVTEEGTMPTELFINENSFATTGTEVVNSLNGNETNKAPSVRVVNDRFNELNVYSSNEIQIGWYIKANGAKVPRYRGEMIIVPSTTAYENLIPTPSGLDECISWDVYLSRNLGEKIQELKNNVFTDFNNLMVSAFLKNSKQFEVYIKGYESGENKIKIVFEYTKTTDTPITIMKEMMNNEI